MIDYLPLSGTPVDELDTPALLVDLDAAEANIRSLQDWAHGNAVEVRPYASEHKSVYIAQLQIEAGAVGVCAARLGEAEALVDGGVRDVTITTALRGSPKLARLVALTVRAQVAVLAAGVEHAAELAGAASSGGVELGIVVAVDAAGRNVDGGAAIAVAVAKAAERAVGLRFDGLLGMGGPARLEQGSVGGVAGGAMPGLVRALEALREAGIVAGRVSAGTTRTYKEASAIEGVTELRCGAYALMGAPGKADADEFKPAMTLMGSVISRPVEERAILDIGLKSVGVDAGDPAVVDLAGATLTKLSLEHGTLELEGDARRLRVGDRVRFLPARAVTTVNQHSHHFFVRRGRLEAVAEIAGRGRFQ